jgi:hypothetical protein
MRLAQVIFFYHKLLSHIIITYYYPIIITYHCQISLSHIFFPQISISFTFIFKYLSVLVNTTFLFGDTTTILIEILISRDTNYCRIIDNLRITINFIIEYDNSCWNWYWSEIYFSWKMFWIHGYLIISLYKILLISLY